VAERIKLYMDEHVHRAVTDGLRRRGVDALTAKDAGLLETEDEQHLAFALGNGRVIFTQDAEFLRLHASGQRHSGIVYAPQQTAIGAILRGLLLIFDVLSPEDMANHVEFIRAI
jgi:uncharacterized protein with PIN domain